MKKAITLPVRVGAAALTMLVAYLLIWPVPISPQKWQAPDSATVGLFAK